ncbi:hypothetical protein K1T71_008323 [Dendrolimus kikuchii]|uniref:Uncharacterized protein n=1 Tax=Dendrolimus kikuchii TaxID=765133 RepID=A0ACC1CWS7_9NEOP|nr:hypothetical protein K1T71_008323 [Dendrolimus kikuchii]
MASHVLFVLLLSQTVFGSENYRKEEFINKLSSGMKFAQDFLASESVALKVAEFVVRAFQTVKNPSFTNIRNSPSTAYQDDNTPDEIAEENRPNTEVHDAVSSMTPLRHLVKLFGLQPNQISAVAVNALVFVAQMISTFLSGAKRPSKRSRTDDPTEWILNKNSRRLQELISAARNESLSDAIEEMIREKGSEEETSCIRLLVCKITPFVIKMQDVVFGKPNETKTHKVTRGAEIMYRHLPTADEIKERNDICEQKHKDCDINE